MNTFTARVLLVLGVLVASVLTVSPWSRARDTVQVPPTPNTPVYVKLTSGQIVQAFVVLQADGAGNFYSTIGTTSYPLDKSNQ